MGIRTGFWGVIFLATCFALASPYSWASSNIAFQYYVLDPDTQNSAVTVYSLSDENTISAGSTVLSLDRDQIGVIPSGTDLYPGALIQGTGPFSVSTEREGVDIPSPASFLGTQFVVPQIESSHKIYLLSPNGAASVTIELGTSSQTLQMVGGSVYGYSLFGSNNSMSTVIKSDKPILVSHVVEINGTQQDAYPVPPASLEVYGVRSGEAVIGALSDSTTIMAYSSDGNIIEYNLDRGGRQVVSIGSDASEGQGSALRIEADKPISAIQYADSDGDEATSFLPSHFLGTRYGVSIDTQYLAVACPFPGTSVTLKDGVSSDITETCEGDPAASPGKAFFGSTADGANIASGSVLASNKPIFVYQESAVGSEEKQLLGLKNSYTILDPWTGQSPLSVFSHADGNTISAGGASFVLDRDEVGTIPAGAQLDPGTEIVGQKAFDIATASNGTDMAVSDKFLGLRFAVPHIRGFHTYDLLSPVGNAEVEIAIAGVTTTVDLLEGQVTSFDAGSNNAVAGVVKASHPIYLYHRAQSSQGSGTRFDAYPVAPADTELWGVKSTQMFVAATEDNTSVSVYADDGTSETLAVQAGEREEVSVGSSGSQGEASAIHLVADKPVSAIRYSDGDGSESTSLWSSDLRGKRFGIPVDAQYLSITCLEPNTELTLSDGVNSPEVESCGANGLFPGKAYFGSNQSGVNVIAGSVLSADKPVILYYEESSSDDEKNLLGTLSSSNVSPRAQFVATPEAGDAPLSVSFDATGSSDLDGSIVSYLWDFGDAVEGNGVTATHTYEDEGVYTATLKVIDNEGASGNSDRQITVGDATESGFAYFDATPLVGPPPLTVQFDASGTDLAGAQVAEYRWEFGDGYILWGLGAGAIYPQHEYTNRGTFTARLIVTDTDDVQYEFERMIKTNEPPSASVAASKVIGIAPLQVEFDGSGSSDYEGPISDYSWDFDNGETDQGEVVQYTFDDPGTYQVQLTVTDSDGAQDTKTVTIRVESGSSIAPPTIETPSGSTSDNPFQISGSATAGYEVVVFVNGHEQASVTADSNGDYSVYAILDNGTNNIVAVSRLEDITSDESNGIVIEHLYEDIPPEQGGTTISSNTVWLADSQPYTITDGDLTIAPGGHLTIKEGTEFLVAPGRRIKVYGTLDVQGTLTDPAVFMSQSGSPSTDYWGGIYVYDGGNLTMSEAEVRYAQFGLSLGEGSTGTVSETLFEENIQGIVAGGSTMDLDGLTVTDNGDWGIKLTDNTRGVLRNSLITDNATGGVRTGSIDLTAPEELLLKDNELRDNVTYGYYGYYLANGVVWEGNWISGSEYGAYIYAQSNPVFRAGNEITNNDNGIVVRGSHNSYPNPVITGNSLYGNTLDDYRVETYSPSYRYRWPVTQVLDATGNWWGTVDPGAINAQIVDDQDDGDLALVDYAGYLDGPPPDGQPAAAANVITGGVVTSGNFTAGESYTITGPLQVPLGETVVIPAGVTLSYSGLEGGMGGLDVHGSLDVQGTSANPVVFTSQSGSPAAGDWRGIEVHSGGSLMMTGAEVRYAQSGLLLRGSTATISDTLFDGNTRGIESLGSTVDLDGLTISNNGDWGVLLKNNTRGLLRNSLLVGNAMGGVNTNAIDLTAPEELLLKDNEIRDNLTGYFGYELTNGVVLEGNQITNNTNGIVARAYYGNYPNPVIIGNSLYGNTSKDFRVEVYSSSDQWPAALVLDATGNWWGTVDPVAINVQIIDDQDNRDLALVDYAGYLDGPPPDGQPVAAANVITGGVVTSGNFTAGESYTVAGPLQVPSGETVVIPAGVTLSYSGPEGGRARVDVYGTLDVQGTLSDPVVFTSQSGSPAAGDWRGIRVYDGGSLTMNGAEVHYGQYGLYLESGSAATVSDSLFASNELGIEAHGSTVDLDGLTVTDNGDWGIKLTNNTRGVIRNSLIANNATGGVNTSSIDLTVPEELLLEDNELRDNVTYGYYGGDLTYSVILEGNEISGSEHGVYLYYQSNPVLRAGNQITNNDNGIFVIGYSSHHPNPIITGNSLYGNALNDYRVDGNGWPATHVLDATGNWWGTVDPVLINAQIHDYRNDRDLALVDYAGYLDGSPPGGQPAAVNVMTGGAIVSGDFTAGESYTITGPLRVPSGETVVIPAGVTLSYSGPEGGMGGVEVYGVLDVQGTPSDPVVFTSHSESPAPGDWRGIRVYNGGSLTITGAEVDYAQYGLYLETGSAVTASDSLFASNELGIEAHGATVTVSETELDSNGRGIEAHDSTLDLDGLTISNNGDWGVFLTSDTRGVLRNSLITDNATGGVRTSSIDLIAPEELLLEDNLLLDNVTYGYYGGDLTYSVILEGNGISGSEHGVYLYHRSNPVLRAGNQITNNDNGIFVIGYSSRHPNPVITGNSLYGNTLYDYRVEGSGWESTQVLDATGNWWGTDDPQQIEQGIYNGTATPNYPNVDYSGYLDSATDPVLPPSNSQTNLSGCSSSTSEWRVRVKDISGSITEYRESTQCIDLDVPAFGSVN